MVARGGKRFSSRRARFHETLEVGKIVDPGGLID
jgi:hypothetical protein